MTPLKAAGYVRVSTARQAAEGLSLPEQEKTITSRAESEGWELTQLYIDAGISGRKADRPELAKLLDALPELDRIVVTSLDRLGRNAAGMLELFKRFEAEEVALVAVRQGIDTSSGMGRLIPNLLAVLAEWESEQIAERVAATAAERAASGKHHGRAPYGYVSRGGELRPDDEQAPIVRRIFERAGAGVSQRRIARDLNADGVPAQRSSKWTQSAVSQLLRNPTFKGRLSFNGEDFAGVHEPIVEPALWDRVAALRDAGARTRNGGPGRTPAGPHLFTRGLLRCGHCSDAMSPRTDNREDREEYRCLGREKNGLDYCPQTPIPRAKIDKAALAYFESVGLDLEAMRAEMASAVAEQREAADAALKRAGDAERGAAERFARVQRDYQDGKLDAEDWSEQRDALKVELAEARAALAEARARSGKVAEAEADIAEPASGAVERLDAIRKAVAGEVADADGIEAVRATLRAMFDAFYVARADAVGGDIDDPDERALAEAARADASAELREAGAEPFEVEGWVVVPHPRAELLEGIDEAFRPILARRGLGDRTNAQKGFTR